MSTDTRTSQSDTTVTSLATSTSASNPTSTPTEISVYTWYNEVGGSMRPHGAFRNLPGTAEFNRTFGESVLQAVLANGHGRILPTEQYQASPANFDAAWREHFMRQVRQCWSDSGMTDNVKFLSKTKAQHDEDMERSISTHSINLSSLAFRETFDGDESSQGWRSQSI